MSDEAVGPVPLHIPAILQNPTSRTARQVEAHNAQQREKLQARRDARAATASGGGGGGGSQRTGKRVVRRRDNASFIGNPHITLPSRSDLFPPVPLHPRPYYRPSFPPSTLDARAPLPSAPDPFGKSSTSGGFFTSLKGVRAMLRKRGGRVEGLVGRVEGVIRRWLDGDSANAGGEGEGEGEGWTVIDPTPALLNEDSTSASSSDETGCSTSPAASLSRLLPPAHSLSRRLPNLPPKLPSALLLSHSPAHLHLHLHDPFDRLVTHLLARYYDLLSFSTDCDTLGGQRVRVTTLLVPRVVRPPAGTTSKVVMMTPETSEVSSGLSASEIETETETAGGTDDEGESEVEVEGYTLVPPEQTTTGIVTQLAGLDLRRTTSASSSSSSRYASSEGGSDFGSIGGGGGLADSLTLPELAGWDVQTFGESGSEAGEGEGDGDVTFRPGDERVDDGLNVSVGGEGGRAGWREKSWRDRPTFFEYLYGA